MTAADGKCDWCGDNAQEKERPFLIQAKLFCSQEEFADYVDTQFKEIVGNRERF